MKWTMVARPEEDVKEDGTVLNGIALYIAPEDSLHGWVEVARVTFNRNGAKNPKESLKDALDRVHKEKVLPAIEFLEKHTPDHEQPE